VIKIAEYDSSITFGGYILYVSNISVTKQPGTIKQKLGRNIVEYGVVGRQTFDWKIQISGEILAGTTDGITRAAQRANLEELDDAESHAYTDGIHDGNYIIQPGSLSFTDSSDKQMALYNYSLTLIEYNQ
jgi:hypothetical protein